jgi:asparagine synthase (glutamine-hydrolysing)
VLSGLGGDEVFGGYPSFRRLPRMIQLSQHAAPLARAAAAAAGLATSTRHRARVRHLQANTHAPAEMYRALRGLLMPDEFAHVAGPRILDDRNAQRRVAECEAEWLAGRGSETPMATTSRLEATGYMRTQLLRDADVMSMAHGLELRVPFVDHVLVGTVWPDLGGHRALVKRKRLLTEQLRDHVPATLLQQSKRGFTLPFATWLDGPLQSLVRSGLDDLAADGWVARDVPDRTWRAWQRREIHWSRAWALGVLGRFLRGN